MPRVRALALAAAAGLGRQWLEARWGDERELIEAAAVVAATRRSEDREDLASRIAAKMSGRR